MRKYLILVIGKSLLDPPEKGGAHCMAEKTSGASWRRAGYPCLCLYKNAIVDRVGGGARRAPPRQQQKQQQQHQKSHNPNHSLIR